MKKEFSQFAKSIVEDKYAVLDDDGKSTETLEQVFRRVANGVGETEEQKQVFYDLLYNREFLPNTPAFMGVGTPIGNTAACFTLPITDDIGKEENGIFSTLREAVLIWQAAGGVGFSFSDIRSEGELVSTSKGQATGPIGFLKAYDSAASVTAQGGKRRAACMGILDISHPDVEKFIVAKDKEGDISSFNLSVGISARFMEAVETNSDFDLVDPHSKKIKKTVNARELFNQIVKHAWKNGEPGIIFLDRMNEYNPTPQLGKIKSTNPCSEMPMLPYENCCLGSINLAEHITDFGTGFNTIDWKRLETTIRNSTRFLDNLIDVNKYIPAVPKLKEMALTTRRIGLGIMGLADVLFMLNKPYDSLEGRNVAENLMNFIHSTSIDESINIAKEKGAFPAFRGSVWENPEKTFVERWLSQDQIDRIKKYGIRNSSHTTIAPTGTISNVAMAEGGGCEPVFALAYTRRVLDKNQNPIYVRLHSELFEQALRGYSYTGDEIESILTEVAKTGSCQNVKLLDRTPELKKIFVVANDISPDAHVAMQAVLQKWCSSSISKTCNLPFSATEEDVYNIYMKAYEEGCKSITVYRSGSRSIEVLTTEKEEKSEEKEIKNTFKRKFSLHGVTFRKATPVGTSYVTVNHDEDENPVEIFVQVAKAGSEVYAIGEAIGRLSSYILQHSTKDNKKTLKDLSEQLKGIGGSSSVGLGPHRVMSLPDAVGQVFYEYVMGIDKTQEPSIIDTITIGDVCPECGHPSLVNTEGCMKCTNCGYSKC